MITALVVGSVLAFTVGAIYLTRNKEKTMKTRYQEIKDLFPLVPKREGWRSPEFVVSGRRLYRGRDQFVAGYGHSRMYAHHMSGTVTDRVVGWGGTQDAAIAMMKKKLSAAR